MFTPDHAKYLMRRLARNEVVLFLGAGFSSEATNRHGDPVPLSRALATALWSFLEYPGNYDHTPLPDMFEALLASGRPDQEVRPLLEDLLLTDVIPPIYDAVTVPYWYRIYTTNVDDLLQRVYKRVEGAPRLDVSRYPEEELRERDQSLSSLQAIFLNGSLPASPRHLTFSVRQYGNRATVESPLYQAFVGDYATLPTVFVGTELNEPLFWQYLEVRERRRQGIPEQRPKSFLITPRISPPKRTQLEALNVVPIEATAAEFLNWIASVAALLPSREAVLRETLPGVVALFERLPAGSRDPAMERFGEAFHVVPTSLPTAGDRSFYLLGATPRWEDIFRDLDAPRDITDQLFRFVDEWRESNAELGVVALLGSAGSGKSTILRRLAVRLSQAGRLVFLTNSEDLPQPAEIVHGLSRLPDRALLLFDNAEVALGYIPDIVEATRHLPKPPILVLACRPNDYDRRGARLQRSVDITEFAVPDLSRAEVSAIIAVLERNGLLGRLQGLTASQRVYEFESRERAGKQLLVAMKEATTGKGFDDIIADEFKSLAAPECRLLYLFIALATDAGYRLKKQQLVRAAQTPPAETLNMLLRDLRGIAIATGPKQEDFVLRHRVIATHTIRVVASRAMLAEAYRALVPMLAADITGHRRGSRSFDLFRDLINHREIFERFESVAEARSIYESVSWRLRSEAHFWLQYGLLELWYGNLEFAENYLRQAESLSPGSQYIQNALGHLYLKQGVDASTETQAYELRRAGSEILLAAMATDDSPYPYHIYCSQRLAWARRWLGGDRERLSELEHLREVMQEGRRKFARNRMLEKLQTGIEREYLGMAVKDSE